MTQEGISPLIIVVIVVVAAVAGVGIYLATRGEGVPGEGEGIAGATSLSFKVDKTEVGQAITETWKAKNIGSANFKLRFERTSMGQLQFKCIVDAGEEKAWTWYPYTGWEEVSFQSYLIMHKMRFEEYKERLSGWTGGEWQYTDPDIGAVRIYDIVVNPDLPDSLFQRD